MSEKIKKKYDLNDPDVWKNMPREDFDKLMKEGIPALMVGKPAGGVDAVNVVEKLDVKPPPTPSMLFRIRRVVYS